MGREGTTLRAEGACGVVRGNFLKTGHHGTRPQARSAVADDLSRPSESMGESAEDMGSPSDGVGGRSEDPDRRSDRLERSSPTPRTRFPGRGPNLPGRRCKLRGPSEGSGRRGECLFVLENGAPRLRFALRGDREVLPMTSAAAPRSWEVVPRTPRVTPSSGRLRPEPSRGRMDETGEAPDAQSADVTRERGSFYVR